MRVLVRPEQLAVSSQPPGPDEQLLGRGILAERSFLGTLRRLRVRLPHIPGTRQVSPALYGEEGLLMEAVLPFGEDVAGPDVWVSLRGWHILAPPQPRLLVCDLPDEGSPAPFGLVRSLLGPLSATATVLAATRDADEVEALRAALAERAASPEIEPVVRRGDPVEEILAEQAQTLYDFLILQVPKDGSAEVMEGLLRSLGTPLLAVPGDSEPFRRILICTAVGEPGKADVRVGGWLARRLGAEVTLMHVLIGRDEPAPWVKAHLDAGLATLRALEVSSRPVLRKAPTASQGILAEARERGYDLIVLGRPGRASRRPGLALQILAEAGKPVLIVPADE